MLDAAEKCNLYDELIESELGAYLGNHPATYDLIASADTLGYFGDLMPLLELTHTALRPGGIFLATVELGEVAREPGLSTEFFRAIFSQPQLCLCML